ncbi:MAG: hypothetical protein QOI94_3154, partial [Acidobacteriaceae bacterium]|nr:hypothetical protein [Acidobacteriaceae bacterium]
QAGRQINDYLQVENGEKILFSKNREAQGEEARVSGQANECRGNGWRPARMNDRPAINAMGQPIPGDVGVKKRVALDLREGVNEPQAKSSSRRERTEDGKHCAAA